MADKKNEWLYGRGFMRLNFAVGLPFARLVELAGRCREREESRGFLRATQ